MYCRKIVRLHGGKGKFKALKIKSGPDASVSALIDKAYTQTLADVLHYTALQGIAEWGHESADSENGGILGIDDSYKNIIRFREKDSVQRCKLYPSLYPKLNFWYYNQQNFRDNKRSEASKIFCYLMSLETCQKQSKFQLS